MGGRVKRRSLDGAASMLERAAALPAAVNQKHRLLSFGWTLIAGAILAPSLIVLLARVGWAGAPSLFRGFGYLWLVMVTSQAPFSLTMPLVYGGRRPSTLLSMMEIEVVTCAGAMASRSRTFARAMVPWVPLLFLLIIFFPFPSGLSGWRPEMTRAEMVIPVVTATPMLLAGGIWALLRPEAAFQEKLTGTMLVHRLTTEDQDQRSFIEVLLRRRTETDAKAEPR